MCAAVSKADLDRALAIGRPPNIKNLFPNSQALIVSGKVVDRALLKKGRAMTIAANGRNHLVIRGALLAAQKANAAIIIEIAKSEGGAAAYCASNYWNLARQVDQVMNELGITVPVAVHADHYGIKGQKDINQAQVEIPTMFQYGITSIAIDASHLPDADNLLASIALNPLVPAWAGLETEVGEIKGKEGMSTPSEALFLIQGLNAHDIFPDWIALNNGTAHGIQSGDQGIQVELTKEIHGVLQPYHVSGAQHGTSGNDSERLRRIANETRTTKANVATALQMLTWGVKVNEYGNAELDADGNFLKLPGQGVEDALWEKMVAYATDKGWKSGNYKKLNLPFENYILSQPAQAQERSVQAVEDFVYNLLANVFNAVDTAPLGVEAILEAQSFDLGPKGRRIEDPAQWTEAKVREKAGSINSDKGPAGDFED
ncbi:MAG: class II fructose-bisphosphate aldolase [Deltaproteobacteria bacterium]|nr:class II fructose-bisphosphate aldolase [Deltaproteobacteria bacterium]